MEKQDLNIPGVIRLDLDISADALQEGAMQVIEAVRPQWKKDDLVFKVFTDGITNKLIGCRLRSDTEREDLVLVRLYGDKTEKIIDRDSEMLAMYVMHAAKCSEALYCQFNNGISYGFVAGSCLTEKTVRDPHIGKLVASEMVKVGAIDPLTYSDGLSVEGLAKLKHLADRNPCTFIKMRNFLSVAPDSFPDAEKNAKLRATIPALAELRLEMENLEKELSQLGSPIVFAHNDILLNNIVYNEKQDKCYFIDFEYASFTYQAFDIGNHFCEWAGVDEVDYTRYPDKPTQIVWLTEFLKAYKAQQGENDITPTEKELETLYVQANKFSLAANLFWGIWALVQARYSSIDFDFLEYSKIRLDQYFKTKSEFLALELPQ